ITFDESGSFVHDTVTLTATQLIRYTQPPSVTIGNPDRPQTETAYPFVINYQAIGGDFANGVTFNTAAGSADLYLPETGANAPTPVTANGGNQGSHAAIFVSFDGAHPPASNAIIQGILLTPQLPITAAGSTLDLIRSPLTVNGVSGTPPTVLNVD